MWLASARAPLFSASPVLRLQIRTSVPNFFHVLGSQAHVLLMFTLLELVSSSRAQWKLIDLPQGAELSHCPAHE